MASRKQRLSQVITKWRNCGLCPYHQWRKNVVMVRGNIPAPILFVGEAPGDAEDRIGHPFVGPAGHLFDEIIEKSLDGQYDYALVNVLGCVPKEEGIKIKGSALSKDSIQKCFPRVLELIDLVDPKLIISVGTIAKNTLARGLPGTKCADIPTRHVIHPSHILSNMGVVQQSYACRQSVAIISDAADLVIGGINV